MTSEWENEPAITAYAVRNDFGRGWIVDGARAPLTEIVSWLQRSRRTPVEVRQIGEPFKGYDPASWARQRARDAGWWYDLRATCWRAPDEFIEPPGTDPIESEALACAFALPESGWMDMTLACGDRSVAVPCTSVFDPIPDLIDWLGRLCGLRHPRMAIQQEPGFFEFHVLPATLPKKHYTRYDENSPRVRFLVLADEYPAPGAALLDVLTTHRILVASIYGAYRSVIRFAPQRFHTEWHKFVADPDLEEFALMSDGYPIRSKVVERWLWGEEEKW